MKRVDYAAVFVFLLVAIIGATQVENWSTDNYSDRSIHAEMLSLLDGKSKYGIVGNTHYPSGPGYLLLPIMKMGVTKYETLRWVPYTYSLLAVALLLLTLVRLHIADRFKFSALGLLLFPLLLPGFVYWQGALHEHSYAMSLSLLTVALALRPMPSFSRQITILVFIGFISGWIGFDFLPAQGLVFVFVYVGHAIYLKRESLRSSLLTMIAPGFALASGMVTAIGTHFLQNTLYFGSAEMAWKDLLGSAAARAGADFVANEMSPEYFGGIAAKIESLGYKADPLSAVALFFESFVTDWSSFYWLGAFSVAVVALVYCRNEIRINRTQCLTLCSLIAAAIFSGVVWTILMPKHAVIHMHFVPRHLLVSIIAAIFILVIALNSFAKPSERLISK
jgi:hypothetical protein